MNTAQVGQDLEAQQADVTQRKKEVTKAENVRDGEAKEGQNCTNQCPSPEARKRHAEWIVKELVVVGIASISDMLCQK